MAKRSTARKVTRITQEWVPVPDVIKSIPLDAINGPTHTFVVEPNGPSGMDIEALFKEYGIQMWGRLVLAGKLMFTVRRSQARWAQYLLERKGIAIVDGHAFCATVYKGGRKPMPYKKRFSSLPAFILAALILLGFGMGMFGPAWGFVAWAAMMGLLFVLVKATR